jgi:hypothetical protein
MGVRIHEDATAPRSAAPSHRWIGWFDEEKRKKVKIHKRNNNKKNKNAPHGETPCKETPIVHRLATKEMKKFVEEKKKSSHMHVFED